MDVPIFGSDGHIHSCRKFVQTWSSSRAPSCMDTSVPIIKPALEWEQIQIYFGQKINGSGIKVAVLDTGINGSHWDIYPRVIHNYSYVSGEGWTDLHGHGTHVAGIIAGNGNRSIPVGRYTGMAPAAYLMNFKVLDQTGFGLESDILAALEDAVTNGSDVICFAIGTFESGNGTTPYEAVHQTCQVY
jgi:subtilisin family serine protease